MANVEDVIREEISYFESIGHDFEWKVYSHDTPPDLKDRLATHGFEAEEPEAILVLDLLEIPEVLSRPVSHDVRRIEAQDKISDVISVQEQVWPGEDFSWLRRRFIDALINYPGDLSVYVAYMDGLPVSSGWIYFHKQSQFASLWGGSTLPDFRKRGLYTALTAVRAQESLRRGVRFLTVDAGPMSRQVLEKLGFRLIAYATACKWCVNRSSQPTR
jgi:predicted GNAT family acetyltransferase